MTLGWPSDENIGYFFSNSRPTALTQRTQKEVSIAPDTMDNSERRNSLCGADILPLLWPAIVASVFSLNFLQI